ncbi:APC family permease [Planosporangium flavigriseum]|uniref:Amino acid transporter n=1 Tax=Planosporangium flavigriseum TaxID=373681 RepID=A0A8J3LU40_9ACTN|nr:amino acid transporter [Planosporangium flavigriseum]
MFMVIAAAAPLTVIGGNVPLSVGNGNGAGAPIGFVIAAAVLLIFSVGFVTMTPYVKEAGAFYSYITQGLGGRLGMGSAYVALVAYTAVQVGIYGYMGWALGDLVTFYGGPHIQWWIYSLATVALVALLGYRHIELSSKVLGLALVLEIAIMVALDLAIFVKGGPQGITGESFTPSAIFSGHLGVPVLFALTGFIGFEATAVFRDEARQPERTIPRATYLAVLIIGVFYAISCWALVEAAGPDQVIGVAQKTLSGEGNMMLDAADSYLGTPLRNVMQVLLCTSLFACVLSFHNVVSRYQFVLAQHGSFPSALGRVHPRHQSPSVSSGVQTLTALVLVVVFAVAGLDPLVGVFGSMAGVSTVGMVLLMLLTSVAVFTFFVRNAHLKGGRFWKTTAAPLLAAIGLIGSLWLVISNFTMVTGASAGVSTMLGLIPVLALVAGVIVGRRGSGTSAGAPDEQDPSGGALAGEPELAAN